MAETLENGYLAMPKSGKGAGVLVLHAWWGLNEFMKGFCNRLAQEGFVALAPDLFHGKIARTIEEAEKLSSSTDGKRVVEDLFSAVVQLRSLPALTSQQLGVVGFSYGAYWALWLSNERAEAIRAATVFYGTGHTDYSCSQASYMGHFAESDPYEPASGVKQLEEILRQAQRPVTIYTYPGTGHWFFEADRENAYNEAAARLAWDRTLKFLQSTIPGDSVG